MTLIHLLNLFLLLGFCAGIIAIARHLIIKPTFKTVANGPALLSSLGILGTFLGIALGLSFFDTTNILASVPQLLDGIKLAFWSSVIGVGSALYHRWYFLKNPLEDIPQTSESKKLHQMVEALQNIEALTKSQGDDNLEILEEIGTKLEMGFGSSEESMRDSLKAISETIESSLGDHNQAMIDNIETIAQTLGTTLGSAENSISNNLASIGKVINDSLGNHNHSMMSKLDYIGETLGASLGTAETSISSNLEAINQTIKGSFGDHNNSLIGKLDSISATLGASLGSAEDSISGNLNTISKVIETTLENNSRSLLEKLDAISNTLGGNFDSAEHSISDNLSAIGKNIEASLGTHNNSLLVSMDSIGKTLASTLSSVEDSVGTNLKALSKSIEASVQDHKAALLAKLETIDTNIGTTLGSADESMSNSLLTISETLATRLSHHQDATENAMLTIAESMGASFGKHSGAMVEQFEGLGNKLEGIGDKLEGIGDRLEGIGDKLDMSIGFQDSVVGNIDAIGERIESSFGEYNDSMLGKLDQLGDKMEAGFDYAEKIIFGKLESVGGKLELGFNEYSSFVKANLKSIGDKIETGFGIEDDSMLIKLDSIGAALETGFGSAENSMRGNIKTISDLVENGVGNITKSLSILGQASSKEAEIVKHQMERVLEEMKHDQQRGQEHTKTLSQVFDDLRSRIELSSEFDKALADRLDLIKDQFSEESLQARKEAQEQLKAFISALEGLSVQQLAELTNLTHKMDLNLSALLTENRELLSDEFEALEAQLDSSRARDSKIAKELATLSVSSNKSMLTMLKEILDSSENSQKQLAHELVKLREDVAADIRATTQQTDALLDQFRNMTDAYKSLIISTTTEMKAQISKEMKSNYQLLDQYTRNLGEVSEQSQHQGLERLHGIAQIMQTVVQSSSDMSSLLHENTVALKRMENAFTGTQDGSLGRFLLDMNNETVKQLKLLQQSFTSQGSLGTLMQDINVENLSQLRAIESQLQNSQDALRELPTKLNRTFNKAERKGAKLPAGSVASSLEVAEAEA